MLVNYDPLWGLLKSRKIKKNEFRKLSKLSSSTYTKLVNNKNVTIITIGKICNLLNCNVEDVVKFDIQDVKLENKN